MSDLYVKMGRIPSNIDLDELLKDVSGNKTKIRNLKNGMVYFLSLISFDNYSSVKWKEGYRRLTDKILSDIVGDERPTLITTILKEKGVIEILPYSNGRFPKGYKLTEKYCTGEFQYIEFSDRIKKKLNDHRIRKSIKKKELDQEYFFIFEQFEKNKLQIDRENSLKFIKKIGIELYYRTIVLNSKHRGFILKSLFNYLGRMVNLVEDLDENRMKKSISPSNLRFNSNITSFPRILRPFLKINGQGICEVDISSSQPYILSTILNEEFTTSETEGYNNFTIFNELYESFKPLKLFIPSNKKGNSKYRLGVFMNEIEYEGIERFTQTDFTTDFYNQILSEGKRLYPRFMKERKGFSQGRDFIKKHIMNFLFDKNDFHRDSNDVIVLLNFINSGLCNLIDQFSRTYGSSNFALLLQRTESYLMLSNVCKEIHSQYPEIPFFTIHDSIITTEPHTEIVEKMMSEIIFGITGKPLKVKSKKHEPPTDISPELIEEIWGKVKICSPERYDKVKYSFLRKNIEKGSSIILNHADQEYWLSIMEKEINESLNR